MKRGFFSLITLFLILAIVSTVTAETEVEIDGQIRLRAEGERKSFNPDDNHMQVATFMRTRVGLKALVDENAVGYVQFQDSRILGGADQFDNYQSGTLNDGKNVDIHQAYVKIKRILVDGLGVKAGRFEVNFGNERVFGAEDWSNVGRSWEGVWGWYKKPDCYKINLLWLKKIEQNFDGYNGDFDIYGAYVSLYKINLDLFGFIEYDADTTFLSEDISKLSRKSIGFYYDRKYQQFDFELTSIYQFGTQLTQFTDSLLFIPYGVEDDISALMFAFEGGFTFESEKYMRAAVGIDYTSGDDQPDLDFKTYNNLYYTGHNFRGYMDYFVDQPAASLVDLYGSFDFDFIEGWRGMVDLHYFSTAADYEYNSNTTKDVGVEIDVTVKTKKIKGVDAQWGVSYFSPKEAFAGYNDTQAGIWLYEQVTLNF